MFADKGLHGATVRGITSAAGANIGAITYHFGSKRALYHAVLDHVFADLCRRIERAATAPGSANDRLTAIVAALFGFFRAWPDAPQLVIRDLVGAERPPPPFVEMARRNLTAITNVVRQGQQSGAFREVQPILVAFSLISQSVWFALVGRHLATLTGIPVSRAVLSETMEHHIAQVVMRSLEPRNDE